MINILLIDDHDLMRMGLVRILNDVDGFTVVGEGGSGEDAIKLAAKLSPDVVLMDVKMPGMGGIEATKRLKSLNQRLKIIALTSCDDELYPSSKTINSYRYRIFEKFEISSDVELVHFAIKHNMFDVDTLE